MRLERTIHAEISDRVMRERISTYFTKAGYKPVDSNSSLSFQRGSLILSLASISPKSWKVNADVRISSIGSEEAYGVVVLDIDTTLQLILPSERVFWKKEMDALERSVLTGHIVSNTDAAIVRDMLLLILPPVLGVCMAMGGSLFFRSANLSCLGGILGIGLGILIALRRFKSPGDNANTPRG
jgi:hypothetical protein